MMAAPKMDDRYFEAANLNKDGFDIAQMQLPWCESPFFEELLARSNLSEAQKKFLRDFSAQGFAVIDPEIAEIDQYADEIRNVLFEGKTEPTRIQDAWQSHNSAPVKAIALAPKVLELLQLIYQREPVPFQTLNFPVGTQQNTHSDTVHFDSFPQRFMCGVWVALEDIDADNGPLQYFPGSHKLPLYDVHSIGLRSTKMNGDVYSKEETRENYLIYEQFVAKLMEAHGFVRKELHIKKGQALIWSANLFHGGSPIRDPKRTRMSQVTHYYFRDCAYYTPVMSDKIIGRTFWRSHITHIGTGEIMPQTYLGQIMTPRVELDGPYTPPIPGIRAQSRQLARSLMDRLLRKKS